MKKIIILALMLLALTSCEEESIYTNKLYTNIKIDEVYSKTEGKSTVFYILFQGQRVRIKENIFKELEALQKWDKNIKFNIMVVSDFNTNEKIAHLIPIK